MNHAIVDKENKVVNVVWWTGDAWTPPKDHMVIRSDVMSIGDTYDHASGNVTKLDGSVHHRDKSYEDFSNGR